MKCAALMPVTRDKEELPSRTIDVDRRDRLLGLIDWLRRGPGRLLFATLCATAATASFMAYDFHALSPYVLIGNPLTLTLIEFFAVPGALLGTALYPLGLDAWVWHFLGFGISFVLWVARLIGSPRAPRSMSMNSRPGRSSFWRSPFSRR